MKLLQHTQHPYRLFNSVIQPISNANTDKEDPNQIIENNREYVGLSSLLLALGRDQIVNFEAT